MVLSHDISHSQRNSLMAQLTQLSHSCCAICLDDAGCHSADDGITTDCGHTFHGHCLKQWFRNQLSCPYCRTVVPVTLWLDIVTKEQTRFQTAIQTPLPCE